MALKRKLFFTLVFVTVVASALWFTQLGSNLVCYVIFWDYYAIPDQSSIFTFKPTAWFDKGSGEWWTYGEDNENYYYWEEDQHGQFVQISKREAGGIPNFSPTDHATWKH